MQLEDDFTDILGKARRGLGLTEEQLTHRTGLPPAIIRAAFGGSIDDNALSQIAAALGLDAPSLLAIAHRRWQPPPLAIDGLAQISSAAGAMTVNAYLVWEPSSGAAAAFDTGLDARPIRRFLDRHRLDLRAIFLTHTHGDHVAALDDLRAPDVPVYTSAQEPQPAAEPFTAGRHFTVGGLAVETRPTRGHSRGGITYVISGLAHPIAIVGDALFAGSIGNPMVSYAEALATNRAAIFSLPADTIIGPGHGPLTTVGLEKSANPFFPEFKGR